MIFLDLETTGFDPNNNKIIEFAAVKTNDNFDILETLDFLVNPGCEIPTIISQITQIFQKDVEYKLPFESRISEVKKFIGDSTIFGHNILFDISFLKKYEIAENNEYLDTCHLSTLALPKQETYSLEILSDVFNIEHKYKHRALGDVHANIDLMKVIVNEIKNYPEELWENLEIYKNKSKEFIFKYILSLKDKTQLNTSNNILKKKSTFVYNSIPEFKLKENVIIQAEDFKNTISILNSYINAGYIVSVPTKYLQEFEEKLTNNNDYKIIYPAKHYASQEKIDNFLKKESFNMNETLLLLKLIRNKTLKRPYTEKDLDIHFEDYNVWEELLMSIDERYEKSKKLREKSKKFSFIVSHISLLKNEFPYHDNDKYVFFELNESDLDRIFGGILFEDDLFKKLHDKNLIEESQIFFKELLNFLINKNKEIEEYGEQILFEDIDSESDIYKTIRLKGQKLATEIYLKEPLIKHFSGIMIKFFNNDKAIRFFNINKEKKVSINVYPISYSEIISEKIIENSSFINLACSTNKNFSTYKKLLGLKDKTEIHFTQKNTKLNLPPNEFPGSKSKDHWYAVKNEIEKILSIDLGRVMILCTNKKQIEDIFLHFSINNELKDKRKFLASGYSGGNNKMIYTLKENNNSVLIAKYDFASNIALSQIEFDSIIITKLPFESPNKPIIKYRGEQFLNPFTEYILPKAVFDIQRVVRLISPKNVYYLDNTIKNDWANLFKLILV